MIRSLAPERVHRTVLSNGLTVLVHEDHSAPVAAVVTYVKAGYFDETDDVVGIAHVLEHMFFKGTPTRGVGQIARQTKASGGYLNAATIYDHTSYYAVLPIEGFDTGLAIQADAYANSLIDAEELRRELEVIIEEAKRKEDNPGAVTTETLYELLHDRHRIRRWRIGREEPLRALRRDQLVRFYRNFYRPSNTVLVIAGDVTPAAVIPRVAELYGALPDGEIARVPGDEETAPAGRRYRERDGDIAETQVAIGWRTPGTRHADTPLLDLAAAVLASGRSSRLYRAVREQRLASSVSAYNYTPTSLGVFVLHADGPAERAPEAARAMWSELQALLDGGVASGDLERAKRLFESRWLRRLETMEGQANFLAEWEALGDWRWADEYAARMLAATPAEVTEAARRYLDPAQASMMVYRPSSAPVFASGVVEAFAALDNAPTSTLEAIALPTAPSAPALVQGTAPERTHGQVSVFRTARGVPILVRRKAGTPIVHLGLYALGGALDETATHAGIATLLARTTLKGTARRSSDVIALETELLGGSIAPTVTSDGIGWTLSVTPRHLAAGIDLLADVVLTPTCPAAAFETERSVALSQLAQLRDDMMRYPVRLATEAAFGAHPYGRGILGNEETLRAVTVDDALGWHRANVRQSPCVLAVVGDVDPAQIAEVLGSAFASLEYRDASPLVYPTWPDGVQQRADTRDKSQTGLALAFPSPSRRDDARIAAHLIAGVASGLGGRFFDELRDKQSLGYTVHATSSDRLAAGMFLSYIACSPEKEEVARAGLLREFAKLCETPVTDAELARARTYALGTHAIAQQSGGNVLAELVDAWMYGTGLEELDRFADQLLAVTPQSMQQLAREYFVPERRVEGIVRGRRKD
ncbi:MAG: insulinase family protein [Gemmatimonadetes bacterium]|nr:insulinase family protein [Gemmatimonadota bacterium]MBK9408360.1 insulinase family protein [Gemmatimonadota bacterium]